MLWLVGVLIVINIAMIGKILDLRRLAKNAHENIMQILAQRNAVIDDLTAVVGEEKALQALDRANKEWYE